MLKKGMIYMDINLEAICGDAIIELKKIESNSVDLIVTDPPYNLNKHYGNNYDKFEFDEYLNFSREWIKAVSYTHLDVYKRQIYRKVGRADCRNDFSNRL